MKTTSECLNNLKQTSCHVNMEEKLLHYQKWSDYFSYIAKTSREVKRSPLHQPKAVANFLVSENILKQGTTLVDIGAGTGRYALEFAGKGADIHAIDIGETSLDCLSKTASSLGLSDKITTEKVLWEEFSTANKFDVSFCAMCPAISDLEQLQRMESITNHTCCILTIGKGSYDYHRRNLLEKLVSEKKLGFLSEASNYYNLLYNLGKNPNVKSYYEKTREELPLLNAIERYKIYMKIFSDDTTYTDELVEEYFNANNENGIVTDFGAYSTALIYWKVDK